MATITEIRDKFVNLKNSIGSIIVATFKGTEHTAIDMNVKQMTDGIKPDGSNIGEYTAFTKEIKKLKGQQTEWVTLRDEGDFQSKMHFKSITSDAAIISSTDWKTSKITDKYGDVFGLTTTNTTDYARNYWLVEFINKIKKALWQR